MAITTYSELQTAVSNWLNRSDLDNRIPEFIRMAEDNLRRRDEIKILKRDSSFTVSSESKTLPTDFKELESLYHDGDGDNFAAIKIVNGDRLAEVKAGDETGTIQYAAIVPGSGVIIFAPEPDSTLDLVMHYWATVPRLSGSSESNWLLANHADIYLYAALVESAPFLKDDERVATWSALLEDRILSFKRWRDRRQFSGSINRRPDRRFVIG